MRTLSIHKPARAAATIYAVVEVTDPTPYDTVLDFGLSELRERRSSVFGCGIRDHAAGRVLAAGEYTVYAYRD